jgi:hypothetical protein
MSEGACELVVPTEANVDNRRFAPVCPAEHVAERADSDIGRR